MPVTKKTFEQRVKEAEEFITKGEFKKAVSAFKKARAMTKSKDEKSKITAKIKLLEPKITKAEPKAKIIKVRAISKKAGNHHQEGTVDIKFDKNGYFETTDKAEIEVLKKHDHKNGFWDIIDTAEEELELIKKTGEVEKADREALISKAGILGYETEMKESPASATDKMLQSFIDIKETKNENSSQRSSFSKA